MASSIQLVVDIDSRNQEDEINEANNEFVIPGLSPPLNCDSEFNSNIVYIFIIFGKNEMCLPHNYVYCQSQHNLFMF